MAPTRKQKLFGSGVPQPVAVIHMLFCRRNRDGGRSMRKAEAFDAWHKERGNLGEELADVTIYLLGLAEMTGVDLQAEVEAKIEKNASRVYRRLPNGTPVKDGARTGQ